MLKFAWASGVTGVLSLNALVAQMRRPDPETFKSHTRRWARAMTSGIGIDVRGFDVDRVDPDGTYIFMANHQSHVDIPSMFVTLPQVPGFLAKAELRRIPLFGRAMEMGGHVFIDRSRHDRAVAAIDDAAREVASGKSIVIFPEGTRSHRAEVMPFKKGGFHLAKKAHVPIVPVGIRGSATILKKGSLDVRAGTCEVHVGEPIPSDAVAALSMEALMTEVRQRIAELAQLPLGADRSGAD